MKEDQDQELAVVTDPPVPDLPMLQQREIDYPAVKVTLTDPVQVQAQPARVGHATVEYLNDTTAVQVLAADPRRQSAWLVATAAWRMGDKAATVRAVIPANVPVPIHHASAVWAKAAAGGGTEVALTVITEMYAQ